MAGFGRFVGDPGCPVRVLTDLAGTPTGCANFRAISHIRVSRRPPKPDTHGPRAVRAAPNPGRPDGSHHVTQQPPWGG